MSNESTLIQDSVAQVQEPSGRALMSYCSHLAGVLRSRQHRDHTRRVAVSVQRMAVEGSFMQFGRYFPWGFSSVTISDAI